MRLALLLCLLLAACSRPLTPDERAFLADMAGDTLDPAPIRVTADVPLGVATFRREKRPRLACRERVFPEPKDEIVTTSTAGVVLWNRLLTSEGWYLDDYMAGYPDKMNLTAALFFAHEMVHVWQWQNRAQTGYSPMAAAREHQIQDDPYLFELDTRTRFLDFGYEQQASIVEEYLCCAVLDPDAPRTARLRALLDEVFPTGVLPRPDEVLLPWKDAQVQGICR